MIDVGEERLVQLGDPEKSGVVQIEHFIGRNLLREARTELNNPRKVTWRDKHEVYENQRGLTIVQNHDVYALSMFNGDQSYFDLIPNIVAASGKVQRFVNSLSAIFPNLLEWNPDELSMHRYDDPEVGLSFHKDNLRFKGIIAILSLEGECELLINREDQEPERHPTKPGDLFLLRAPGLTNYEGDMRPEHSVVNLRTPTRVSMMLRSNARPHERLKGFEFDNWPEETEE